MKKLPEALLNKQESERRNTASMVTNAIIELQSQGYNIRIKDLMFVSGLSRSVFAKPHIRKVLVEYGIVNPGDVESTSENNRKQRNINAILAEKDGYIDRLLFVNEQLRQECEVLRGQVHLLTYKNNLSNDDEF